ncbi:MAG: hypothetical protein J6J24_01845, partial [Clostridia bacterium]|nr:hypothetical protein [Clostridia bacterium]
LEENEMINLLSLLKLGDALGYLKIHDHKAFDRLLIEGGSANLKEVEILSQNLEENVARSRYINRKVKELVSKLN